MKGQACASRTPRGALVCVLQLQSELMTNLEVAVGLEEGPVPRRRFAHLFSEEMSRAAPVSPERGLLGAGRGPRWEGATDLGGQAARDPPGRSVCVMERRWIFLIEVEKLPDSYPGSLGTELAESFVRAH